MFFKKAELDPKLAALEQKQKDCKHQGRFTFYGSNRAVPPFGTCDDCGAEVALDVIMNTYLTKLDTILDAKGIS